MTTASTTLLGLALPVTGELTSTWGDVVNASLTNLLDTAIAGTTTLSSDADVTLSTTTLAANQARQSIILWTAGGTATRTITAPAQSKSYVVINATTSSQSIKLVGAGPTAGITVIAGEKCLAAWNGSDFVKLSTFSGAATFSSVTVSSTLNVTGITTLGQVKNGASFTSINGTTPDNLFGGGSGNWAMGLTNASSGGTPYGLGIKYTVDSPNGTGSFFLLGEDASNSRFYMRSNGGLVNYSANNVNLSDAREKINFSPATSYLDKICAIPVQTFNYIDQNFETDDGLTLGVVAQDVLLVAPELVTESNWAPQDQPEKLRYSIYQTDLQYALMKCIQELRSELDATKARVAALEAK